MTNISSTSAEGSAPVSAANGERLLGYFIDLMVFASLTLVVKRLVPQMNITFVTLSRVTIPLLLLVRDVFGASPGKMLLGFRVVKKAGGRCNAARLLVRNLPLVLGSLGRNSAFWIAGPLAILSLWDSLSLLGSDQRLGDRIAGTTVIHRPDITIVPTPRFVWIGLSTLTVGVFLAASFGIISTGWQGGLLAGLGLTYAGFLIWRQRRRTQG